MARTIAIANQKGGVGQTTTAVNLAASLATAERRTLLVDADPQGNATSGVGVAKDPSRASLYDLLIGRQPFAGGEPKKRPMGAIAPNPFQPRRSFDETQLKELADSIAASGLLQPVIVRARPEGRYELIAGERRWRAAQRLGWSRIPAVVRDVDDRALLTLALIENLQRDALSPQ